MKIAFGFKMGTGKDSCCNYLINKYDGEKVKFSQPLYEILNHCQTICNFPKKKDRYFLQTIGIWARNINEDVWINLLLQHTSLNNTNYFLSDLRFRNEFEALRNNGWTLIKLERNVDIESRKGSGTSDHISENDLNSIPNEKWDFIIENNGTPEELYQKLDTIIQL